MNEQTDLKVTTRNVQFLLILVFDKNANTGCRNKLCQRVCRRVHLFWKCMVHDKVIYLYGCLYVIYVIGPTGTVFSLMVSLQIIL